MWIEKNDDELKTVCSYRQLTFVHPDGLNRKNSNNNNEKSGTQSNPCFIASSLALRAVFQNRHWEKCDTKLKQKKIGSHTHSEKKVYGVSPRDKL